MDVRDDKAHFVSRLESFSDVVFGFGLAQTAINLVVTSSVSDFFAHPFGIIAYLITFFLVARMWWSHAHIMHRYFEPNPLMIVLNFFALASLGLMIFGLQLWLHRGPDVEGQLLALRFYFLCFVATIGTLAIMRALGVYYRWAHLSPEQRRTSVRQSITTLVVNVAIVVGVFVPTNSQFFGFDITPMPAGLLYALLFGAVLARFLALAFARSRWGETEAEPRHA